MDLDDDAIDDIIIEDLESCIRQGECNNIDNGQITSCNCVAQIDNNRIIKTILEYNKYETLKKIIYKVLLYKDLFLAKQKRKSRDRCQPEFHIKGILYHDKSVYNLCQNGFRDLFSIGYKNEEVFRRVSRY